MSYRRRENSKIENEIESVVMRRGFLDTSKGLYITEYEALALISAKEANIKAWIEEKYQKRTEVEKRHAVGERKKREKEIDDDVRFSNRISCERSSG